MPRRLHWNQRPWSEETIREQARLRLERKSKVMPNGCIEWTGLRRPNGYGETSFGSDMKTALAHRVSFALARGLTRRFEGCVCHKCDNPLCINPDHLFLGTQANNIQDKIRKGRQPRGEANYNARLTAEEIRTIRADQRRYADVAADYGIHPMYVGRIKRREVWAHVD